MATAPGYDPKKLTAAVARRQENAMRVVMLTVYQVLNSATPVDTGFARAGYSPSTGSPTQGPSAPPLDDELAAATATALQALHDASIARIAGAYRLTEGKGFITNPVHYLRQLNQGSSAQAPANFIERGITQEVNAAKAKLAAAK